MHSKKTHYIATSVSLLSICTVLALLFSFGLHSVQISHMHPGHAEHYTQSHSEGGPEESNLSTAEYMHAADKKLFVILAALSILAVSFAATLFGSWKQFMLVVCHYYNLVDSRVKHAPMRLFDFLTHCFSIGILKPKLH